MSDQTKPKSRERAALAIAREAALEPLKTIAPTLAIVQHATRLARTLDWDNAEPLDEESNLGL
jgi:hypothetical protein